MKKKTVTLPLQEGVDGANIHLNHGEQRVVDYMLAHGSITSMEAFQNLGETRLSARIFDLRTRYKIKTIRMEKANPEGEYNSYYAKYVFDFPTEVKPTKKATSKATKSVNGFKGITKKKETKTVAKATKKAPVKTTKPTKAKTETKKPVKKTTKKK